MFIPRTPQLVQAEPTSAAVRAPGWVRCAEWWFVPAPDFKPRTSWVRQDEQLALSPTGRVWTADYCVRFKPERIYACPQVPGELTHAEYQRLLRVRPEARQWTWRLAKHPARMYVRGVVRLIGSRSVTLVGWYRAIRLPLREPRSVPAGSPA